MEPVPQPQAPNVMQSALGLSWKTSVTGYIETICLIIMAVVVLPIDWSQPRAWIPAVLLVAAKTIKDSLTKDKNVTGGDTLCTTPVTTVVDSSLKKD
jgi:hypothetical protein